MVVVVRLTPLHVKRSTEAVIKAFAEAGVFGQLGTCVPDWRKVSTTPHGILGWVRRDQISEVEPVESRE